VGIRIVNFSDRISCWIGLIDRISRDVGIQIEVVFAPDGVSLEEPSPLTRPVQVTGIFPWCLRGLRSGFAVAIHAPGKNRLEAVWLTVSKTFGCSDGTRLRAWEGLV
jgi:hypothetical protein